MRHKCQKQKRVVTNKQKMVLYLITDIVYIPQAPGFSTMRYQETGSSAKWSSLPLSKRKRNATLDS